jgi:hypothetical protein
LGLVGHRSLERLYLVSQLAEEFRDRQRRVEIRQRLHERFNQWLEKLEARVKAPQPTWKS